jgi:serine/threonine protein phosphatase 1
MPRTIAIGDIHGSSYALESILSAINPEPDDTIITLGDYVNRGMHSKGVLDLLVEFSKQCRLIPILGNHDEMLLKAKSSRSAFRHFLEFGGIETLDSYGDSGQIGLVPDEHFEFLESCMPYFETGTHFFTHGNYNPELPLEEQRDRTLRWLSLRDSLPGPHQSGKIAVVGHTPQSEVLNLGHLICLDTGCVNGGKLTAMEMVSGQIWQTCQP